jgi:hypothetical protein
MTLEQAQALFSVRKPGNICTNRFGNVIHYCSWMYPVLILTTVSAVLIAILHEFPRPDNLGRYL